MNNLEKTKNISLDKFLTISVLGKGSYAKVILVKKIDNQKLYAMKIVKKSRI